MKSESSNHPHNCSVFKNCASHAPGPLKYGSLLICTIIIGSLLLITPRKLLAQNAFFDRYFQSQKLFQSGKYKEFYPLCVQLLKETERPKLLFELAVVYARNKMPVECLSMLEKLATHHLPYDITKDTTFLFLHGSKRFQNIIKVFKRNAVPFHDHKIEFELSDNELFPEGIAVDKRDSSFYISSVSKQEVLKYSKTYGESFFISPLQDSIGSTVGMKIDKRNNCLWVCNNPVSKICDGCAGIFGYDLSSHMLLRKYILKNATGPHFFNDLTILINGDIFFTDSKEGKVYAIHHLTGKLITLPFVFYYPNGITADGSGRFLFVADFMGLRKIDLESMSLTNLKCDNFYFNNIDGLYYYRRSLIAIQNPGDKTDRVIRIYLTPGLKKVTNTEVLQTDEDDNDLPTTGTLLGNQFYYISNSQLRNLKENGEINDKATLRRPAIFSLTLIDKVKSPSQRNPTRRMLK